MDDYTSEFYTQAGGLTSSTVINLPAEATVTDINASLGTDSRIYGKVTGQDGITPLVGVYASVYRWNLEHRDWDWVSSAQTNGSGDYSIRGLVAGTYRVQFRDSEGNYEMKSYDGADDLASGKDIILHEHYIAYGINVSLASTSQISGKLTGNNGTTPLAGIYASAYRWSAGREDWVWISGTKTDLNGNYSIGRLATGTYRLEFRDAESNYALAVYNGGATLASGADIVVPAETTVTGINASLATFVPPVIVSIQKMAGAGNFHIHYTGQVGQNYTIQGSSSLSGWQDIAQHTCQSGVNIIPLSSTAPSMFWRLKTTR